MTIQNRYTGAALFTCDIDCHNNASRKGMLGLAVRHAITTGSDLSDADLFGARLSGANLTGARLSGADFSRAYLAGAILDWAVIPSVANIDARILAAIEGIAAQGGTGLNMEMWHTCDTAHCRGGWAIHLAGEAGYALEKEIGYSAAAALIYAASRRDRPVPDFNSDAVAVMADLRACAAADAN